MDEYEPLKYIEKIVLEIVDRRRFWFHQSRDRRIEKFNIGKFNAREAAYAFLKQYTGQTFVKAQKIVLWLNDHVLLLCVRDLIYETIYKNSNSMVEFIYRRALFREIRWPGISINQIQSVNDHNEIPILNVIQPCQNGINTHLNLPKIQIDDDSFSMNVDEATNIHPRVVTCISCDSLNEDQSLYDNSASENTMDPLCRNCRVRRSVSGLQKLINNNDTSITLKHDNDDENHFQSSIHIYVNNIKNSSYH